VKKTPPDQRAQARQTAQRQALNALRKARRIAAKGGVELSEWEGEFLGSVEERLRTYGRAFGDPEKGAPGQALSMMQSVKLKEITGKAKGEKKPMARKPFRKAFGRAAVATVITDEDDSE
jgi:hypothetical protein